MIKRRYGEMIYVFFHWNKCVVLFLILSISFALCAQMLYAQEKYPARNIELIIPWGPGGIADVVARIFADELSKVLKVTVSPINKPGATGTIGAALVADAKKDGYTLLSNTGSGMTIIYSTLPDVPYDIFKDFTPISTMAISPSIIAVKADSPLKSLEDLINEAKKNPEKLTYGTAGIGSDNHFNSEHLQIITKIKCTHIPFKSGAEALTATLGGHTDFIVSTVGSTISQLKAGRIRGLVISGNKRVRAFSDLPTLAEKGYPQHFFSLWVGLFAPAGIPRSVMDTIVAATEKIIKSGEFNSKVEKMGSEALYMSPVDFRDFLEKERKTAKTLAEQIGLLQKK